MEISTISFDLDNKDSGYPFPDGYFDAAISLVTIEHLINPDHLIEEIHRILCDGGNLYITTPNYAAPEYLGRMVFSGKSFHDPLAPGLERYEFYGHVQYFTYRTLLEYVRSLGFVADTVYIALPEGSSRFKELYTKSKSVALAFRYSMWLRHPLLGAHWASEPIICFEKASTIKQRKI